MINPNLHKKPVALDRIQHRGLRLDTQARDMSAVKALNAFFVSVGEVAEACKEYPVVFVNAGPNDPAQPDGPPQVATIAVFGLQPQQNLCIEGEAWKTRYIPQALRLYPFAMARMPPDQLVVVMDEGWAGFQSQTGEALFDAATGEPSAFTLNCKQQLELFEQDVERTRLAGNELIRLQLLREMRFDATLPDGQSLVVDGFLTVDEQKLAALPDAEVLALHRNGLLGLIHAHLLSLGNMAKLVDWHAQRAGLVVPAAAPAPAAG